MSEEIAPPVDAVLRRYRWIARAVRAGIAVVLAVLIVGVSSRWSPVPGIVLGVSALLALYLPLGYLHPTHQLQTDRPLEEVVSSFTGPTPPVLGFQWGQADEIRGEGDVTTYTFSSLLRRRTAVMLVRPSLERHDTASATIDLRMTVEDEPWARYRITCTEEEGGTAVDITGHSHVPLSLRYLPDAIAARRLHARLFDELGYDLEGRGNRYAFRRD